MMKKTAGRKSHWTVPLIIDSQLRSIFHRLPVRNEILRQLHLEILKLTGIYLEHFYI